MNYKITGLSSLLLVIFALLLADIYIFTYSIFFGLLYLLYIPTAFLIVMYNYCRKCPHVQKGTCRHVVLGGTVKKLWGYHEGNKYTISEVMITLISLVILILLPQYFLFKNILTLIPFWIMIIIGVIIVITSVCKSCENKNCTFCQNKQCTPRSMGVHSLKE